MIGLSTSATKFESKHRAFPYQVEAAEFARQRDYVALFHEQGLGKTKIALDLLLDWLSSETVGVAMVVTKKALVKNWVKEVQAHTYLRPIVIGQNRKDNYFAFNRPGRLYITHYETLHTEKKRFRLFARSRKIGVILDESQRIKNPESQVAKALHELSGHFDRRVIMSGTPVANRPYDIWSQVYFLDSGNSLGDDFSSFKSKTNLSNDLRANSQRTVEYEELLSGIWNKIEKFTIRMTKEQSGIELPSKSLLTTVAELEERQRSLYEEYRKEMKVYVEKNGVHTVDDTNQVLKRLLRLVQVCSNPTLIDDSYSATPGKISVLDGVLSKRREQDPKTIVWTSFIENIELLAKRYKEFLPATISGRMNMDNRNRQVERFLEDPGCRLLVATPGAAKEGLTLTVANHAIFYDRSLSLDDYLQAQDRIHRVSQSQECLIEIIVATDTIDEWISALLWAKRLSAQLAQGDISLDEYRDKATYDFNLILQEIIGQKETQP